VFLSIFERKKKMSAPPFSKNTPNKIGDGIAVAGKNTLIKRTRYAFGDWRAAISDEPIDATVDGKKMFCVHVDNAGNHSSRMMMMVGFTSIEKFDSTRAAWFGNNGFTGTLLRFDDGSLCCSNRGYHTFDSSKSAFFGRSGFAGMARYLYNGVLCLNDKFHDIIDKEISSKATEIIVILTISNNGTKKEIRFLCDGKESKSTDVSEYLIGDFLFPAICLADVNQQVTTIPIDQIKKRTPEIENLINNQVISQLRQQINDDQRILIQEKDKQIQEMRKSYEVQLEHARLQMDEFRKDFLKQLEMKEKQLESKDQQFQREREIFNKQLELERAENQQLRNLLQQQKIEMCAMEIYYLKRESGQRREREEEFKVKEEPKENEEEKPIQHNNNNKKNKNKNQSKK
jgi:hypothetical protein